MNTNKSKNKNKLTLKNLSKRAKSKKVSKKGCHSCSSSSSSSCCSDSFWSSCSSSSYRSCSISSSGCSSSSSSDSSCRKEEAKTLTLGNKYITVGGVDGVTLKFDPSQCNTLSAPLYPMGFSLANITNGTATNSILLLGSNQLSTPYIQVDPRYSSGNLITPNMYFVIPPVDKTSTTIDLNSNLQITNDYAQFTGLDGSSNNTVSGTFSSLGLSARAASTTVANYTQTAIFGPRSYNLGNSLTITTNTSALPGTITTITDVVSNILINNSSGTNAIQINYSGIINNGDIRIIDCIHVNPTTDDVVYNFLVNGVSNNVFVNGTNSPTITVMQPAKAVSLILRAVTVSSITYYIVSRL